MATAKIATLVIRVSIENCFPFSNASILTPDVSQADCDPNQATGQGVSINDYTF